MLPQPRVGRTPESPALWGWIGNPNSPKDRPPTAEAPLPRWTPTYRWTRCRPSVAQAARVLAAGPWGPPWGRSLWRTWAAPTGCCVLSASCPGWRTSQAQQWRPLRRGSRAERTHRDERGRRRERRLCRWDTDLQPQQQFLPEKE